MPVKLCSQRQTIALMASLYQNLVPRGHKISLKADGTGWHISKIHEDPKHYREQKVLEVSEDLHTLRVICEPETVPEWVKDIAEEIDRFFGSDEVINIVTD